MNYVDWNWNEITIAYATAHSYFAHHSARNALNRRMRLQR